MRNIVNIVNFVRGVEPRYQIDLVKPIRENIRLLQMHGLKSAFLLQYDALENDEMMSLITKTDSSFEKGAWLEVVESMAKAAGIEWRGEYSWDHHAYVDFLIGYPVEQRYLLIDAYMGKFYSSFGYYPKTVGSWMLDCRSLDYLSEKYNIKASCICRDQHGTDGYTIWGGYYNHGYYPSKNNMLCPASSDENKISTPMFRMLGSDMLMQYDAGLMQNGKVDPLSWQPVYTLEPAYNGIGGNNPNWVNWYMGENYKAEHLGFNYTQAGQENSFGWDNVGKGLEYQYALFAKLQSEGKITVEHMCETGEWFQNTYNENPTCSMTAMSDWTGDRNKTAWYYNDKYRINIMQQNNELWIRDLHLFDENYREKYYDSVETTNCSVYDTLPLIDGYRFSGDNIRAGGFVEYLNGESVKNSGFCCENISENGMRISSDSTLILCEKDKITISGLDDFQIRMPRCLQSLNVVSVSEKMLSLIHNDYDYCLNLKQGYISISEGELKMLSEDNKIIISFQKDSGNK